MSLIALYLTDYRNDSTTTDYPPAIGWQAIDCQIDCPIDRQTGTPIDCQTGVLTAFRRAIGSPQTV